MCKGCVLNITRVQWVGLAVLTLCLLPTRIAWSQLCPEYILDDREDGVFHLDCHFEEDDGRFALVDDRGGQGVGLTFAFDRHLDDPRLQDACPHCSLAVFVADVGLDFDELEFAGVNRDRVESVETIVTTLQELASADVEALATELRPNLEGADLEAFVAELTRIVNRAREIVARVQMLAQILALNFDFENTDFRQLLRDIGFELDSAFRADFDNPNDPRHHTSGVSVYDLEQLLLAMAQAQLPQQLQDSVGGLLTDIPGLPGVFEISGDDDNALAPASFHGVHTNLTVRQRTYIVDGADAYLVEYVLVNDTRRILPLVEVAMITDFDIFPGSRDTSTAFDPATTSVSVYDSNPLRDPVQHAWFGMSPYLGPGADFVFANYNLDKNLSLSQFSPSIDEKRFKFFLWHPDVSGDHDDAVGKSEKQGAISLLLPGAMMPGDQRRVAFCFAGDRDDSQGTALVTMKATLEACKAFYGQILLAECGDGILQLGEECDDPNRPDLCSNDCEAVACADGRINGPEACDDGNTDDDDGCSALCRIEVCGDGIRQANEACDDGNDLNTDACLTTCTLPSCGDGYLRRCDPNTENCGAALCGDAEYCLVGTLTFTDQQIDGGNLDDLLNRPIGFGAGWNVQDSSIEFRAVYVTTGPVTVQMQGDARRPERIAPYLSVPDQWSFSLVSFRDGVVFEPAQLTHPEERAVDWSLDFGTATVNAQVHLRDGYPILGPFDIDGLPITLRRTERRTLTDRIAGVMEGAFVSGGQGEPVGEEVCDDANTSNLDGCLDTCLPASCGDGYVFVGVEECDDGNNTDNDGCNGQCNNEGCGDGVQQDSEECDDNNNDDNDGCSATCRTEVCGDGVRQDNEDCDDGNNDDGDGCDAACVEEFCGDGTAQGDEACDDGNDSDTDDCLTNCLDATCGDGIIQDGVEDCDDGNTDAGDGCGQACADEFCGDGLPGPDEECDDGNADEGDGCSPACRDEFCGDTRPGPGEQCDDGNEVNGDGCDKDCMLEDPAACGNGTLDPGEQCDDGNTDDGDGCSPLCQFDDPAACGDGHVDPSEQCDDGNNTDGDGCGHACNEERCGDGFQQPGEQCDDGNNSDGDGCDADCQREASTCGDGNHELGEQCDDGNTDDGDGCSAQCLSEGEQDIPALLETCGNGALDDGEQCDDGNMREGDGCDELCQLEASVCGNGAVEFGEACDDRNDEDGDGCDANCQIEGFCGDTVLGVGEQCDDGNTDDGDGCDLDCRIEAEEGVCGDGARDDGEACDDGNTDDGDGCSAICTEEVTPDPVCGDGVVQDGEDCDDGELNGEPMSLCPADCTLGGGGGGGGCGCELALRSTAPAWGVAVALVRLSLRR